MNVRDSMRARYSALSTPASSASKRQRSKAPLFGHKSAAERVNRYKTEQQNLKNTERQKLALENASLKDEVYHLQLKLANAIKKESILKSKRRDVDRQLMSASSLSSHSRSPRSRSSSRRTRGSRSSNPESPQRPSTTSGTRSTRGRHTNTGSPFRPVTAPHEFQINPTVGGAKRASMTTRLIATPNNEYKDFIRRIDRLKQRVGSLETQLSEEKTKSRLVQLRQLTNSSNLISNTSNNRSGATGTKHGMPPSFWEELGPQTRKTNNTNTKTSNNNDDDEGYVAAFHADQVLHELVSQKLLEASLHMEYDVRKEWSDQLKVNVERLCGVSKGFKTVLQSISNVVKTSPFTSANTAATIAKEISNLFGAKVVRIFIMSHMNNEESKEKPAGGSSFTFVPIAYHEKENSGKLLKSEKMIVDIQGLTTDQVADRMRAMMNDSKEGIRTTESKKDEDGPENVLLKNSKGIGFVAGTFLTGQTIHANGDLWQHECFNMSTDGSWIEPGEQSLLSLPVRFKPDSSKTVMTSSSFGGNMDRTSSIPFAVVQLLRATKKKSKDEHQNFDEDSLALLKTLLEVLGPALYSCSRPMTETRHKKQRTNNDDQEYRTTLATNNRSQNLSRSRSTYSSSQPSSTKTESKKRNSMSSMGGNTSKKTTKMQGQPMMHMDNEILCEVTSRRIRRAAELAGVEGDVSHVNAPGMVRFLHSVTAIVHCALSADRSCLYLSQDMFGGIRVYHDDDILFAPISRAKTPLSLASRLAMLDEGMGHPDDDDNIIDSLQKSIQWDPLDGSGTNNNDGLSSNAPFHVHEDMDDQDPHAHHHQLHQTHHHHHKPRSVLRKRTDLAAYVASNHEVVRMTNAHEDPHTKFAVDNAGDYITDSILVVPIIFNGETVGVLELFNKHELSGGNEMLSDEGFNKQDELMVVHCVSELSFALSSVERQGRAERMSDTFCKLYHHVGLATSSDALILGDHFSGENVSRFGHHLLEVEAVVRQLLVAEHVFIWVSDHKVGGLRTYFQQRKSSDLLLDVHYSQKQLLGSALGAAYFSNKSLNYHDLADVRAKNLQRKDGKKLFKPQIDIPDHVPVAQSMICVPLVYSGSTNKDPVGVLQIINLDTRELAIRSMRQSKNRFIQFTEQVAAQTATCIGCLLRMDHFARDQQQTHDLLGTFSELHHSSSLKPLDLILSSVHAVSTIFKSSNRKVTRALLILRDQDGNFIWARRKNDSPGNEGHHSSGTGAFDDMFHTFDAEKNKKRRASTKGSALNGRRPSQTMNQMVLHGDNAENYEIATFSSSQTSFAKYVITERRPIIVLKGREDVAHDVAGHKSKEPKVFTTDATDQEMNVHTMGATLGVCVPVSQLDGDHTHDIQCVLLLQRDENSNLQFSSEDRDLAGLVVSHLCAAIASVWNTTDQLRRERALGDMMSTTQTSTEDNVLLTMELDENGRLVSHNGLSFQPQRIGFVSKTLWVHDKGSNVSNVSNVSKDNKEKEQHNDNNDVNSFGSRSVRRINLNLAPDFDHISQLKAVPFDEWLCKSVHAVIQQVLDAVEEGKPPNQTWATKVIDLPEGPSHILPTNMKGASPKKKKQKKSITNFLLSKSNSATTKNNDEQLLNANKKFQLLAQITKDYMITYCHFNDDGEASLLGVLTACDVSKAGTLALSKFTEIVKCTLNSKLNMKQMETLAHSLDSLILKDSTNYAEAMGKGGGNGKRVHYVKFVRAMVPPIVTVRRVHLTVIPTFSANSVSHKIDGIHLKFVFDPNTANREHAFV